MLDESKLKPDDYLYEVYTRYTKNVVEFQIILKRHFVISYSVDNEGVAEIKTEVQNTKDSSREVLARKDYKDLFHSLDEAKRYALDYFYFVSNELEGMWVNGRYNENK